ncbi:MAG TPA: c-type cytochrome [Cyclobacteriaceae bacterium]|nr:c-type cytochrome [Cyclobacteriaceae bacterium]
MKKFSAMAIIWACISCSCLAQQTKSVDKLMYHYDRQRSGWNPHETRLTPKSVSGALFTQLWQTPAFDTVDGDEPRLFAAPLYVDRLTLTEGPHKGKTFSVVFASTDVGYIYAVNATAAGNVAAGTILWKQRISDKKPSRFGNIGTPIIDLATQRIYAVGNNGTSPDRVYALDIRNGKKLENWPVALDSATINAPGVKRNGDTQFPSNRLLIQRGSLNLNADGSHLYVTFAGNWGWIVAIDTRSASVASAFSVTSRAEENGGIWASSGPSIDSDGNLHMATGSNVQVIMKKLGIPGVFPDSENNWGQSVIRLRDDPEKGLVLTGTYSPFNWAISQVNDIDLSSSGTVVIDLDPATTSTPHLLVSGGKQGNVYLLDRTNMPGSLVKRPAITEDPSKDQSLLSPEIQPQFGKRGPLSVFGPYGDENAMNDQARSRTTSAYFKSANGKNYVFATGSAKTGEKLDVSTPPGLARLEIVTTPGQPAYLKIDQLEMTQTFHNPSSPIVTSNGGEDAIIWVMDTNAPRTTPFKGPKATQRPFLYAFDALTFKLLWKSAPNELGATGKYNEVTVVNGVIYVGTDRIQAYGLLPSSKAKRPTFPSPFATVAKVAAKAPADPKVLEAGKVLVAARCAVCHTSGTPGIPTLETVSKLEESRIVDALMTGVMKPQAAGLTQKDAMAIAAYLTSLSTDTKKPAGKK